MSEIAIKTDNLTCDFDTVRAVDQLTLQVPSGIVFGFLGPNGAGKTTTIRLLLGLLEPSAGSARLLGYDTISQAAEVRARTGALLEHNGLYEQMSAYDNLEFYGRVNHMSPSERQARIRELLTQMELWERRSEPVKKWSRGMKQKLALARVLLHRPALILLDEPTAGLDVPSANAVRSDLEALVASEGVTVFLTTHNMTEAERLCSQIAVIREGQLQAIGHPDELRARSGSAQLVIVGRGFSEAILQALQAIPDVLAVQTQNGHLKINLNAQADTAALVTLLVNHGAQVQEARRHSASLEEVFLTLVEEEK